MYKTLKALHSLTPKEHARPELTCVHVDGKAIQATDSYKLLKVTNIDHELPASILSKDDIERVKVLGVEGIEATEAEITYPNTQMLLDEAKEREYNTATVNVEYLEQLCKAIKTVQKEQGKLLKHVTLHVSQYKRDAVYITDDDIEALLMPIIQ